MPAYMLTYARTVILKRHIEARDHDAAMRQATALEKDGKLGLDVVEIEDKAGSLLWLWGAKPDSEIHDIQDDENIWEIEPAL